MAEEPHLLRVGIDARLVSGDRGGVEQVIIGLAHGLSQLHDGDERYLFLADEGHTSWLEPYLSGSCSLLMSAGRPTPPAGQGSGGRSARSMARRMARAVLPARIREALKRRSAPDYVLPPSDGSIETAGVEVMHFPMQVGFGTTVPTIFTPHDLQHLHLPEFFTPAQIAERETSYRDLCARASVVVVMSSWGKDDIVERYGLPRDKVLVVPSATTLEAYHAATDSLAAATAGQATATAGQATATRARLALPERFALYPAKAWPHKNHLRLVEAIALLRKRGVDVPLVFTGGQGGREVPVMSRAQTLGVADLVHFTGFVSEGDMAALYGMASLMVFPSLFEGWGLPILEAMSAGLPVACSTATCLPAQTAGAALLFDPTDPAAIADAVAAIWTNAQLAEKLAVDGRARAAQFSWVAIARIYRACYRSLAGRPLSPEDQALLDAPPLV